MKLCGMTFGFKNASTSIIQENLPPEIFAAAVLGVYSNLRVEVEWMEAKNMLQKKNYFEDRLIVKIFTKTLI